MKFLTNLLLAFICKAGLVAYGSNLAGIRLERKRLACLLVIAVTSLYGERSI